jgi:uncharacterized protein (TIGR02271 family)
MSELTLDRLEQMRGATVYDSTGDKIGTVEEIFYDEDTNRPEWIGIGTGFFGTKRVLVPIDGARVEGDEITIRYSADQVKDSPDIDSDEISYETEQELYAYYRLGPSSGRRGTDDDADQELTRAEEELRVGKETVESGRARLRKWVETEPVEAQVELRQETAQVTRERIDQPVEGVELGEEEIEVPLHEERAVVEKRAVAKERVGIKKDVKSETETVRDEVRKERVEVDEDN